MTKAFIFSWTSPVVWMTMWMKRGKSLLRSRVKPILTYKMGRSMEVISPEVKKTEHLLMKLLAMMKLTGILRDDFLQYVVCPKCMTVYMLTETYERRRDGTKVCRTCGHIPFYNHPQQRSALRKKYGSALLRKATYSSGEEYVHPIRSYCYESVVQSLGGLVKRLGFEEKLDERRKRELPKGVLGDVNDGQVWQDYQYVNSINCSHATMHSI
nr:uncharacterized protein LOC129431760 isoform X1 [Misgurnus anguillicaudatus]